MTPLDNDFQKTARTLGWIGPVLGISGLVLAS